MDVKESEVLLADFLNKYEENRKASISMHASESPMSSATRTALSHDLSSKYSSDDPGNDLAVGDMIFGGSSSLKLLKDICSYELQKLLDCDYVSHSPLSGLNAADIIISALTKPGDHVLFVSSLQGGHPVFPQIAKEYGLTFEYIPFQTDGIDIDWGTLSDMLLESKPALLYFDASDFLQPFNLAKFFKPQNINTKCIFDVSHVLGLVGSKHILNPLNFGFDAIVGSTHKSFPGPHKGIFGTRDANLFNCFNKKLKTKVSSTHSHHILALTIALLEFKQQGAEYIEQIIKNANAFANALEIFGLTPYRLPECYTKTHQIWLPFSSYDEGIKAFRSLESSGIYSNFIKLHHGLNWGIRFGLQEVTFYGFKERDAECLAVLVGQCCNDLSTPKQRNESLRNLIGGVIPYWKSNSTILNLLKLEGM